LQIFQTRLRITGLLLTIVSLVALFSSCKKLNGWPDAHLRSQLIGQMYASGLDSAIVRVIEVKGDSANFGDWKYYSGLDRYGLDSAYYTEGTAAEFINAWLNGGSAVYLSKMYGGPRSEKRITVCSTVASQPDIVQYLGNLDAYDDVSQVCLAGARRELEERLNARYNDDHEHAFQLEVAYGRVWRAAKEVRSGYTYLWSRFMGKLLFLKSARDLDTSMTFLSAIDSLVLLADTPKMQCEEKRRQFDSIINSNEDQMVLWRNKAQEIERQNKQQRDSSQLREILK
jgi:hypothetical protein